MLRLTNLRYIANRFGQHSLPTGITAIYNRSNGSLSGAIVLGKHLLDELQTADQFCQRNAAESNAGRRLDWFAVEVAGLEVVADTEREHFEGESERILRRINDVSRFRHYHAELNVEGFAEATGQSEDTKLAVMGTVLAGTDLYDAR